MSANSCEDLLHALIYGTADRDESNVERRAVVDEHLMKDAIDATPESRRLIYGHAIGTLDRYEDDEIQRRQRCRCCFNMIGGYERRIESRQVGEVVCGSSVED